jgi:hypothetical protein
MWAYPEFKGRSGPGTGKESTMTGHSDSLTHPGVGTQASDLTKVYQEGIVAGMLGAATVALWHLILDTVNGHPLYTPTVMGTALFRGGLGLESPHTLQVSFEMVVVATWVHFLVFALIGGAASRLLAVAEQRPNVGFGVILLFVVFECGFLVATMAVAQPMLHALAWSAVLVGNLLAAVVMAVYFWRRHPHLKIAP